MSQTPNQLKKRVHYLFEFLIIVAGITLSFLLDEYRTTRDLTARSNRVLSRIQLTLVDDMVDLASNIQTHSIAAEGARLMAKWAFEAREDVPQDSLESAVSAMLMGTVYLPNEEEYNALKSSGQIEFIRDTSLVKLLYAKYSMHPFLHSIDEVVNDFVRQHCYPMLNEMQAMYPPTPDYVHGPYQKIQFPEGTMPLEFSFISGMLHMHHNFYIQQSQVVLDMTRELHLEIERYLGRGDPH